MDNIMVHNVDITFQPGHSADFVRPDMNKLEPAGVEEDDSNLSSAGSDPSDRSSGSSTSQKGKWKVDTHGNWRYGSSDSTTSTSISSTRSSIAADDKKSDLLQLVSPSRKRMSDGSVKQPMLRLNCSSTSAFQLPQVAPEPLQATQDKQNAPKNRRGRPPKENSTSTPRVRRASRISKLQTEVRPRSSIPARIPVDVFASQCIEAAHASRLNPFALHPGEHALLVDLLMSKEVTVYLNIRNAILRLWTQNPLCSITAEEAAGCAKEGRFYGLAEVAYKWLLRNGYINFGCVEVPQDTKTIRNSRSGKQKTVVVVGAGVSGLTTARQLEHLFAQDSARWTDAGERPPRVIVLEGRRRVGGRVYSKELRSQVSGSLPGALRNTVEMGAMIVTGFEHGNPLDTIIRGQLGLRYHLMKDALTIYDCDGKAVNEHRDMLNTELYTDISDRAGDFRALPQEVNTLKGDEELISRCRDPAPDGFEHFHLEPLFDPLDNAKHKPAAKRGRRRNAPPGTEKLTGRTRVIEGSNATQSAARAAKTMGWPLREGIAKNQSISLQKVAHSSSHPTLGSVMDEAIGQYQDLLQLAPQDLRLLNWHHANLEYANAAPVSSLSLSGHDQDTGNEFEGAHSEIVGGYTQLPRGLLNLPTKLDVRFDRSVDSIHYNENAYGEDDYATTKVVCTDGEVIEADEVVVTAPLGVLKADVIDFDPLLPSWKQGVIDRMGFGLLNKVILLYDQPFWDDSRDMFGLLNEAENKNSLDPDDYAKRRGRFYLIWNASPISGRPALVALMAGNAAHDVETTDSARLLAEINGRLGKVFPSERIPAPTEVIVTRWKKDPFTRGTYSYVGPKTRSGDYDLMAEPVGNLHFAGEATCGTHPATVHGAFLSGLRVAAEVMDAMAGPINLPMPLVGPAPIKQEIATIHLMPAPQPQAQPMRSWASVIQPAVEAVPATAPEPVIKQEPDTTTVASAPPFVLAPPPVPKKLAAPPKQSVCAADNSFWVEPAFYGDDLNYEANIIGVILSQIGDRPVKPSRPGVNPFLLFTKDKWEECKAHCSKDSSTAGRDAIRSTLGKWWKAATDEAKQPYLAQGRMAQEVADAQRKEWATKVQQWDADASCIRKEYMRNHPPPQGNERAFTGSMVGGVGVSKRKTNVSNCVVLDHS
ncbi:hypothetical protein LTR37_007715 [Vermiconidia calcicola]|uniref:Uncharacterized protein n=1 Tax=Vermiconidia calcicola TaxID=1690605 RepID=A0ACC3NCX7_9PEZI|nr:hypothetical protein LTR37_007715 [Vermiconidia calcicola]